MTLEQIIAERPFEERADWRLVDNRQTKPWRPNRCYIDKQRGIAALVVARSRKGRDFAVSADAISALPLRAADPASWLKQTFILLVDGNSDRPAEIVIRRTLTIADAAKEVAGRTPYTGRGDFGDYYWFADAVEAEDETVF
jgi:hypothetical protein